MEEIPDLVFGVLLITLYRLLWVITLVSFWGADFWLFWCGSYHYSIPFQGMSSIVLMLAWCWSAFVLVNRWRQRRHRWWASFIRLLLMVLITCYFLIGIKTFGGVTCTVGPEPFMDSWERPTPYLPVRTDVTPVRPSANPGGPRRRKE